MNRRFLLLLLIFIFIPIVHAEEACEMSDDYAAYLKLEDKSNALVPPYCKSTMKITSSEYLGAAAADSLASKYSSVDKGYVTSIKDQGDGSYTCWAFAANAMVETSALKQGLKKFDLSEMHMAYRTVYNAYTNSNNFNAYNVYLNSPASEEFAMMYYFNHYGPVNETTMPYKLPMNQIKYETMPSDDHVLDVGTYLTYNSSIPVDEYSGCTDSEIKKMKESIVKYGGVMAGMNSNAMYLKDDKGIYWNNFQKYGSDHAILVVGWDDSISYTKFKGTNSSSKNGAWLVKSSWGTEVGNSGYIYVSYNDQTVCRTQSIYTDVSTNKYDRTYSSNIASPNYNIVASEGQLAVAAEFTPKEAEDIKKISIGVMQDTFATVYYAKDLNTSASEWTKLDGEVYDPGNNQIASFVLNKPIHVTGKYFIVVAYETGGTAVAPMFTQVTPTTVSEMIGTSLYDTFITSGNAYYKVGMDSWQNLSTLKERFTYQAENDKVYVGYRTNFRPIIYVSTTKSSPPTTTTTTTTKKITTSTTTKKTTTKQTTTKQTTTTTKPTTTTTKKVVQTYDFTLKLNKTYLSEVETDYITFTITGNLPKEPSIKIFTSTGIDSTSKFKISGNTIYPKANIPFGDYRVEAVYSNIKKTATFTVRSLVKSTDYIYKNNNFMIRLKKGKSITIQQLEKNILTNTSVVDKNKKTAKDNLEVATGYYFKIGNNYYPIAIVGDPSGDGKITALDYIKIKNHIMGTDKIKDTTFSIAADANEDGKISALDYITIKNIIMNR